MSELAKFFDGMMRQSQDMAEKMGMDTRLMDPWREMMVKNVELAEDMVPAQMKEALEHMVGQGLDPKARALTTVAGLTARGAEDTAILTTAINAAIAAGASNREISETILQMAGIGAVTGVPKAMTIAMGIMASKGGAR
ncbi:MAG: carboxymuconolactone decarboxylase family protein [Pseudomonadota bacterium]